MEGSSEDERRPAEDEGEADAACKNTGWTAEMGGLRTT